MRILFIVPYAPNPVRVRSYNLIKSLSARGYRITLATLWKVWEDQKDIENLAIYCHEIIDYLEEVYHGTIPNEYHYYSQN